MVGITEKGRNEEQQESGFSSIFGCLDENEQKSFDEYSVCGSLLSSGTRTDFT